MKHRFQLQTPLAVLAASSSLALAAPSPQVGGQIEHAQGFGSTWAFGIRIKDIDPSPGQIGPGLRVKDVGGQANVVPVLFDHSILPPGNFVPDFELLEHIVHPIDGPMIIEVNAHSSSNAQLPRFYSASGVDGMPDWGSDRWLGLSTAIEVSPTGNTGSLFDQPKAAVVAYYFKDNTGIDPIYSHTTFIEHTRRELGIRGRPFAYISSLDYGLGAATFSHQDMNGVTFNDGHFYYFSVSQQFVTDYGNHPFAQPEIGSALVSPCAGDIYVRQWNGSNAWTAPKVYRTATELGMDPLVADIDALEVDHSNRVVIFSVTSTEAFTGSGETSQIMVSQRAITASNSPISEPAHLGPVRDTDGAKVMTKLQLTDMGGSSGDGEVTALCAIDPELAGPARAIGVPLGVSNVFPRYLGMSIGREAVDPSDPSAGSQIVVQADGWGTFETAGTGFMILEKRLHNPNGGLQFAWSVVEVRARIKRDRKMDFIIPDPDPLISGTQAVDFRASYIDNGRDGRTFSPEFSIQFDG